jgi:hypothetical protein
MVGFAVIKLVIYRLGSYKTNQDRSDLKSTSKSKKRKISKRNRSKAHDNAQTPISMTKMIKNGMLSLPHYIHTHTYEDLS